VSPLQSALRALAPDSAEQHAIAAGEIDAVIDYSSRNVILLPAARRALREAARKAAERQAANETAGEVSIANRLLAGLPPAQYQRVLASLEPLTLKSGEVLHQPGMPIRYAYFPIDCVVSLLAEAPGEGSLEVALVGYEGMVGISLALGSDVSCTRALVQSSGTALRIKASRFAQAMQQSVQLQDALYRYAFAKLAVARQTVACNRFHAVEARLARWLLMTGDRVRSAEFVLTQGYLAGMLGVRRATVNEAAGVLQQRGLIGYSRARITVVDRQGLEAAACSCYAKI
jgi:CRP-like cAMP-binding protein